MLDWLAKRRQLTPDRLALVDDRSGERLDYRTFDQRANFLAQALQDRVGVKVGDRLAVLAKNRPEYFLTLFAAAKLGAILVPLNVRLTPSELAYILADSKPVALFTDATLLPTAQALGRDLGIANLINYDTDYPALVAGRPDRAPTPDRQLSLADPYIILYTSGTTGRPKGAILTHGSVTWNAVNTAISWDVSSADRVITCAPLFHTGGINVFSLPLFHLGGTVVLMEGFGAERVLELTERESCTLFFGVPTMLQLLVESPDFPKRNLTSLRWVIAGGATCPEPVISALAAKGIAFRQGYGLTEAGPNCFAISAADARRKPASVGHPIFHEDARVLDDDGRQVGPDEIGELVLRGPHTFAGYWNNPEATARTLRDGWVYTGDLVRRDTEGHFWIIDRKKDMYKSGGENVYPLEVERVIETHPKVAEVAVIGVPDPKWDEVGKAYVVLRPGESLTLEELNDFCRSRLAKFKLPRCLAVVEQLPRNSTGKVQKAVLKEMARKEAARG